ncbi:hypothetical protein GQ54DRAFT_179468 [Martensiomyces pterosporus]|nr:hypothetical protein GQ54DRAFT_179468 [Martensiomyces pterosporus]
MVIKCREKEKLLLLLHPRSFLDCLPAQRPICKAFCSTDGEKWLWLAAPIPGQGEARCCWISAILATPCLLACRACKPGHACCLALPSACKRGPRWTAVAIVPPSEALDELGWFFHILASCFI